MLCWANENWTRRWDGKDEHILLKQDYSLEDDLDHIRYLIPIFKDPRYIKINGRPVFAVYRSTLFPDMAKTIHVWREEAAKEGLELYICRFETFGAFGKSYMEAGFDAAVEFPPMNEQMHFYAKKKMQRDASGMSYRLKYRYYKLKNNKEKLKELKELSKNRIDYGDYVEFLKHNYRYPQDYCYYPGVCPSWDNTARNKKNPFIFLDSTPDHFKTWLTFHRDHYKPNSSEENFIFINAWNEWAEGNHLEPCRRWGTAYLEAVRDIFGGR
jgi:lipopolysaccharide biosynthesis protein